MSSDGCAVLLQAADRRLNLTPRMAACFADHHDSACCEHSVRQLITQRL